MMFSPSNSHMNRASLFRTLTRLSCIGVALLLAACATETSNIKKKQLLVIGNSNYLNWTSLQNPINDKNEVCNVLSTELEFGHVCKADVATRKDFERLVDDYVSKLQPDSTGVFYYSGHGVQVNGINYLVPTGIGGHPSADDLYPVNHLFMALETRSTQIGGKKSGLLMIVLDACRSSMELNDTDKPQTATPLATVRPVAKPTNAAVTRGTVEVDPQGDARPVRMEVLNKKDAPNETILLFATAANTGAFDGTPNGHGPLTEHFLSHVRDRGLDIEDLVKDVTVGVRNTTRIKYGREQAPFTYQSFTGQFCFAGCFNPENFTVPVTP
jgi:Caspase domain